MSVFKVGSNKSSQNNFPSVRPTLDLDFANSKTLDPRITFTRASGGSYVGADGLIKYAGVNEPRFDHDPVTGESLGFLVEESRTNLFTYSGNLPNPDGGYSWSFENTYSAPDGGNTASKVTQLNENASTISRTFVINDTTVTYTMFTKAGSGFTTRRFGCYNNSQGIDLYYVDFNYNTGIASEIVFYETTGTHSVDYYGNGWYRIRVTITSNITSGNSLGFYYGDVGGLKLPETIGSYFYVWGGQIEQGSFPTSYIPTDSVGMGSSRTRAADNAQITGKNFSSWYRQDEVSCFISGRLSAAESYLFSFSADSGANRILSDPATYALYVSAGGVESAQISSTVPANTNFKFVIAAKQNSFNLANAGVLGTLDTSGAMPTVINKLNLFTASGGSEGSSGTITRITYYPKRLTDAQLQVLTR